MTYKAGLASPQQDAGASGAGEGVSACFYPPPLTSPSEEGGNNNNTPKGRALVSTKQSFKESLFANKCINTPKGRGRVSTTLTVETGGFAVLVYQYPEGSGACFH